jgi:hypothetical protein
MNESTATLLPKPHVAKFDAEMRKLQTSRETLKLLKLSCDVKSFRNGLP